MNPYSKVKQELQKANQNCCKPRDLAKPTGTKFSYLEQSQHNNQCQGSEGTSSPSEDSVSSSNSSGRDCTSSPETAKSCSGFVPTQSDPNSRSHFDPAYHGQDLRYL